MPHPTLHEIIISCELLFLLWPLRVIQRTLENRASKEGKRLRRAIHVVHVRSGHEARFKHCAEENCELLTQN